MPIASSCARTAGPSVNIGAASEKQARSVKYQITIAKLPLAKDIADFAFDGTPINAAVSAWIGTAFAEADADAARKQWRTVADQLRPRVARLAGLMDTAETDVLAFMAFPREHRVKIHSTNPLERLNSEIKRRTNVVGIFPNGAAIVRLVGAILLEQNDE